MRLLLLFCGLLVAGIPAAQAQSLDFFSIAASEHQYVDSPIETSCIVYNFYPDTIHSFTVNWAVDAGAITTIPYNVTINPSSFVTPVVHPVIATPGHHTLKIWTALPNGSPDIAPANDTQTVQVLAYPYSAALHKKELLYEFTGAWCGYCTGGALIFQSLLNNDSNCIGAAVHLNDVMSTTAGTAIYSSTNTTGGVPVIAMDQFFFMPIGATLPLINTDSTYLPGFIAQRKQMASPVNVSLSNISYDSVAAVVSVDVTATMLQDLTDVDYRINLIVTEDSVLGGTDYDQSNYNYSHLNAAPEDTTTWLYPLGETLTCNGQTGGWAHRHVVRFIANSTMGNAMAIPTNTVANTAYTSHYDVPVGATWRKDYITLIGTVEEYKPAGSVAQVLNAGMATLKQPDTDTVTSPPAAIANTAPRSNAASLWPNPAGKVLNATIALQQGAVVTATVYTITGQATGITTTLKGQPGNNKLTLPTEGLPNGLYCMKIGFGAITNVLPFTVVH